MMKRFALALLLIGCLAVPGPAGAQALRVGYISKDLNHFPYFVEQKKGFLAKEGVQVDLVNIGRSDIQLEALVARELHISTVNADGIIIWNERSGGNLKVVGGTSNAAPYLLIGAKNIKRVEDLKGQKVGVASIKGGATSILVSFLKSKGLNYPRDYSMIVISGGTPSRLSALANNSVAGAILGVPFGDIAVDKGFTRLGDTMDVISNYQFNGINVNPDWAEKNRPLLVRFLKAHIQGLRWIYDNPAEAADMLTKEFGLQPPYARRGIDYYIKYKVYPINGDVTLAGLRVNIQVQAEDGILKEPLPPPEKYADLSYIRQAQKELGLQ
jgi:ABC-type nitrate/sulfonate/bicarbonate transport system substrate-binding protein